ncbi:hypothetical protein LINPERHAP1_LOCUS38374 [Linum perenne]
MNAPLQKIDDDLWLLFCDSKTKVERILSLDRRNFGDIPILFDKWIPAAGLSNVLREEGVIWVTIRGIPLHLRSSDLFRQIGSVCGEFLGYEICSSLSSVRLKIRKIRALPKAIPVRRGSNSFILSVIPDSSAVHEPNKEFCPVSVSKGKTALTPILDFGSGYPKFFEVGSSSTGSLSSPEQHVTPVPLSEISSFEEVTLGQEAASLPLQKSIDVSEVSSLSPPVNLSLDYSWMGMGFSPLLNLLVGEGIGNSSSFLWIWA